ncbi:MAG: SEC-C domain-containing protein [Spirochaetaceae bacterium]|nr:SEC-C domain-containing protein [Spirochaetaceae bacterium]HPE89712.1 SEC-C domain-containing protein [Spirochaetales bacterium]
MACLASARRELSYRQGKRALAAHDAAAAVKLFRAAVSACPAAERRELARDLYWLSVALRRLGKDGLAIKALANAQRLEPRGRSRALYARVANQYGMPKASCAEHDDYRAFCSIQLRKYLSGAPGGRFDSQDEIDAVLSIIAGAWVRLGEERPFADAGCEDKLRAFRDVSIEYPTLRERGVGAEARVIAVDFFRGKALRADDRCTCGSGLPYGRCCGRVRLPYEAERD